jgi:hypothetical protein
MRRLFSAKEKDPVLRTLQRFATVCFIGAAFAALVSACGSDAPATNGGAGAPAAAGAPATAGAPAMAGAPATAGAPAGGATGLTGNAAMGMTLYSSATVGCNTCHGPMGEGDQGPNITGSTSAGIGAWTEPQFHDAVRNAKDKTGVKLYFLMPAVDAATLSDQGIADIYAFLMSKKVETANPGKYCTNAPGMCKGTH